MSILLRPDISGFDATLITAAAAVAVANAVKTLSGKTALIKWVNDVLTDGKKICGILTEGSFNPKTGKPDYVILGIGINAFTPKGGFPPPISQIAGAVFSEYSPKTKAKLAAEVINNFFGFYKNLGEKTFLNEYRLLSAVTGKNITVFKNCSEFCAKAIEIDDSCRLLVEYPDKSREYLSSGEISIKL